MVTKSELKIGSKVLVKGSPWKEYEGLTGTIDTIMNFSCVIDGGPGFKGHDGRGDYRFPGTKFFMHFDYLVLAS